MPVVTLECDKVVKSFGSLRALDGLTFTLQGEGIKGLIGPNGSGKSVLLNVISRVPYPPDGGSITFNGRKLDGLKPSEVCKLGIGRTFQTINFFPTLTVGQNLLVGSESVGTDARVVDEALKVTRLYEKREAKASALSVFELKKLMMASSLALDPKLILLDEPLGGLGEAEAAETLRIIREISDSGKVILIVEHRIRDLMGICDDMFVLHLGRLIAHGPPDRVVEDELVLSAYFGVSGHA
jgi:branched-chain amino acid transport system ATP-binding protein